MKTKILDTMAVISFITFVAIVEPLTEIIIKIIF